MYGPYSSARSDVRPFRDAETQIRDLTQDFATAFNTGNYDQAAGMFASDGVLMVPGEVRRNTAACVWKPRECSIPARWRWRSDNFTRWRRGRTERRRRIAGNM